MKILIVTGIKEELRPILEQHPFDFDKQYRFYRSKETPSIYAGTLGPGLKRTRDLEKFLTFFEPEVIINAGLVGILNDDDPLQPGDLLKLGTIYDTKSGLQYPGGPGRDILVTVDRPVFQPWEKMELHVEYLRARACDMEAGRLLKFTGQLPNIKYKTHIVFCKVVGDRPEAYLLYENEHLIRNWEKFSLLKKIWVSLRFPGGPFQLKNLLNYKHRALASLTYHINMTVINLLKENRIPPGMNSVFIPH